MTDFAALTDAELGYAAGLIDGEGHLEARPHKSGHSPVSVVIQIRVGMTDLPPIEWLQEKCGGVIKTRTVNKHRPTGRKTLYDWRLGRKQGAELLRILAPYLIIKRDEALLWLEISDLVGHHGKWLTDEEHGQRLALMSDLRSSRKAS